jgi:acyl-CoA reductase-like NAD-dependent aldehyde dehydrogenase
MATATNPTERLSSYNPATNDLVGTVPIHGQVEVDAAVARARVAAARWGALSFAARAE